MKIKNLKYILWALPLFILFFINGFLFAADSVSDPSQCSGIPNHSTNPANNQNNVNISGWYYNDIQGLERYYQKNNIGLSEVMMGVINHRWALFSVFDSQADLVGADKIWHLQNAINTAGCGPINTDCKLGTYTSQAFFNLSCDICRKIDSSYVDVTYNNPFVCRNEYEEVEVSTPKGTTLCCKPAVNVEFSDINIVQTQWQQGYLHVDISSSLEDADDYGIDVNVNKITAMNANGENLSNISAVGAVVVTSNNVKQSITIQASTGSAVTVNVNAGFFQALDDDDNIVAESHTGSETFTPEEIPAPECSNPPGGVDGESCEIYGGTWYYDSETNCCISGNSCLISPDSDGLCPGNNLVVNAEGCCVEYISITCESPLITPMVIDDNPPSCSYGYSLQNGCCACELLAGENGCGDGYSPNTQGCCRPASQMCGEDQYMPSGSTGCIKCAEGTIPNDTKTKCLCDSSKKCCGIQLNTVVPFIGDCIEMNTSSPRGDTTSVTSVTAFPILVQGLMKILMSAIMVFSFLMIIIAGLSMVTGAFGGSGFNNGKKILKNVLISLILLGCSGLILSLINPSFFGG